MVDFIAEVSSNHNRDIGRMKNFITTAKNMGCSGVKFQLFRINELFAPEILNKSEKHRNRRAWELPEEIIPELASYTHSLGLSFSCTPFYLGAVEILEPYVDFYKIASYELLWLDLFEKCANTGKPVVFSIGMATPEEISSAITCLLQNRCPDITVLLCNSAYPTPLEDVNLAALNTLGDLARSMNLSESNKIKIGYSDHSVSPAVIYRAVHRYNADFIEFHLDLDGEGEEFAAGHCWLPNQMAEVIENIGRGFLADGQMELEPSKSELPDREWRADPSDGLRPLKHKRDTFEG